MVPWRTGALARALHHPIRATLQKRIYAAGDPVPLPRLAQALDLTLARARYHVRVLAACGLVEFDRAGRAGKIDHG